MELLAALLVQTFIGYPVHDLNSLDGSLIGMNASASPPNSTKTTTLNARVITYEVLADTTPTHMGPYNFGCSQ